jgi:hypothetical protein
LLRRVFSFHRPETPADWMAKPDALRSRLAVLPETYPPAIEGLRICQVEAITHLEQLFTEAHPRVLIQMAAGAGKTYLFSSIKRRSPPAGQAPASLFASPAIVANEGFSQSAPVLFCTGLK